MDGLQGIEEILAAAQDGDVVAEEQLFLQLSARILALVQQRIRNTQDPPSELHKDAEDLTANICAVVLQQYKTAPLFHGFVPWVMQIARNKIGQYYRYRKRTKGKLDPVPDDMPDSTVGPEGEFEGGELDDIIFRALEKMGPPCVKIIEALMEGDIKTYIKQHTTTPMGTIYSQIHRCRERLKLLLRKNGYIVEI